MMKSISPVFKDDRDKIYIVAMLILSLFFVFIPPLIVVLVLKEFISENSYQIAKAFLNFEILLTLISLSFMIPIIGWIAGIILCPLLYLLNIIIVIIDLCAIAKKSEVKIPVPYEFI